ncbi:MAG: DoxX family protein [Acidiferrobacteraceae bacterium]|jgi:putative oxidoreductase
MDKILKMWTPAALSLLRIVTAFLFMQHGGQKLLGFPAPQRHAFDLLSLSGMAGVLELFGGALLLVGLFTRPVAFLLSGLMAFAYFIAHAPRNFWPLINHGELAVLFCFVFLYLAFAGGGSWSVDRLLARSR